MSRVHLLFILKIIGGINLIIFLFCPPCPFTSFSCWIQKMYIAISCPQSPGNISEVMLVNAYIVVFKDECLSGCRLVNLGQGVLHVNKHVCPYESL